MTLNRASGLWVIIGGIILLFWIIPSQTEPADYGWLKPATLPKICAVFIIFTGLTHLIFPSGKAKFDVAFSLRVALFFVISCLGLYLMSCIGFILGAPILISVIMLLVGERRPLWLFSAVILLPAFIWFCVSFLLNKPLP